MSFPDCTPREPAAKAEAICFDRESFESLCVFLVRASRRHLTASPIALADHALAFLSLQSCKKFAGEKGVNREKKNKNAPLATSDNASYVVLEVSFSRGLA